MERPCERYYRPAIAGEGSLLLQELLDQTPDQDQDDGADDGADAEQADDDVPDESAFLLDHEEPGQPAGNGSEEQGDENVHVIGYSFVPKDRKLFSRIKRSPP